MLSVLWGRSQRGAAFIQGLSLKKNCSHVNTISDARRTKNKDAVNNRQPGQVHLRQKKTTSAF
jgi:hypothetical protein